MVTTTARQISTPALLSQIPKFTRSPVQASLALREQFGDVVWMRLGFRRSLVLVSDPAAARQVLQENHANYVKQSLYHRFAFRHVLGQGLLMAEGDDWQHTRRMMQPGFRHENVTALGNRIDAVLERELDRWESAARQNQPIELFKAVEELARKVNNHVLVSSDSFGPLIRDLRANFSRYGLFILASRGKWLRFGKFDYPEAAAELREAVRAIIRQRCAGRSGNEDILDFLIQAHDRRTGAGLSEPQLLDEIMTLIFAGSETTEKPLAWIWYLLGKHPDWAGKIYQAVQEQPAGRSNRLSEKADCLVEAALNETMRLYPPAWILGRRALGADKIGERRVAAGDVVVINIYALHHHPKYWREPERFDPARFLAGTDATKSGLVYLPFGAGPRNCLGSHLAMFEMRRIVTSIARRFRLELEPGQEILPRPNISLTPKDGVRFRILPRG